MRKLCDLTQSEIDLYRAVCNFTPREEKLFILRTREYTLDECAEQLNIGRRTADRVNKKIIAKIAVINGS